MEARARSRAARRAAHPANWVQLGEVLRRRRGRLRASTSPSTRRSSTPGLHYLLAATCSFLVAVTSNYLLNRLWTFRDRRGGVAAQGMRFFVVSLASLGANLLVLHVLITLGAGKLVGQAIAIVLVTPLNFVGNKLWSFRRPRLGTSSLSGGGAPPRSPSRSARLRSRPLRRGRDDASTAPVFDGKGRLVQTPFAPPPNAAHLTKARVLALVRARPEGRRLARALPDEGPHRRGDVRPEDLELDREDLVGQGGRDRRGQRSTTRAASSPRRGPARRSRGRWRRGYKGAFGGVKINNPWLWGAFCLVFLLGLADFRRPLSVRNLDLLMLLSPTASLWFFNHGDVFTAVPLFYPALVWVVAARRSGSASPVAARRRARCGRRGSCSPRRCSSPASASA